MKVYDLKDKAGRVFAFEVGNTFLTRRGLCRVVRSIPGARILKAARFGSYFKEAEFCKFEIQGQQFVAWEPFGDNSRYWIGPDPPHWCEQVALVRKAFIQHRRLFAK
jgi:hypothetical protein